MNILTLVVVGLIIGAIARLLMPGRDPIGILGTLAIGVVGALLGGALWAALPFAEEQNNTAWIGGIIVAMALLFVYRKVATGRSSV